jgi:cytochrome o ubiquinol oxidase subunit 2
MIRILVVLIAGLLSGCHLAVLEPHGLIASEEKRLILLAFFLMMLIVVPVIIMTVVFAWRFRASNKKSDYQPEWSHNTWLEIIWWGIPCILIVILATITWRSTHQLDPYRPLEHPTPPIRIQVISLEWKWLFIYPDLDIAVLNYLEIPKDTPIDFFVTSEAPMNSFWIPQISGQIYAMEGMQTQLHVLADKVGEYRGLSASFSGDGFSEMTFTTKVVTKEEFNNWVHKVKFANNHLNDSKYRHLVKPSTDDGVIYFSSAESGMFGNIMMRFMMPM